MDLATARQIHDSLIHVCAPPVTLTGVGWRESPGGLARAPDRWRSCFLDVGVLPVFLLPLGLVFGPQDHRMQMRGDKNAPRHGVGTSGAVHR
eukprot:5891216-Pyramimonas_sp.AAC.1